MNIRDLDSFDSSTLIAIVERRALAGEPDAVLCILATHTAITKPPSPKTKKEPRRGRP